MNHEENRLNSFRSWPSSVEVDPVRIARAGFYYTGRGVEVQCFCCGGKISEWNYGDQAMARHRRLDPRCPFLLNPTLSGNVTVAGNPQSRGSTNPGTRDSDNSAEDSNPLEIGSTLNQDDEIYRNDALRLLSFINWPVRFISRESLASAGFYHAGGGRVRCAWCGGELCGGWRHGDRPLDHHRRHFPHCQYARLAGSTNNSNQSRPTVDVRLTTEAPVSETPHEPTDEVQPQTEAVEHNWRVLESPGWRALGVVGGGAEGARHPARSSLASRLATFAGWPPALRQTPALLAEAGFYYTGSDDQVRCFYCDGGLGKWEPSDVPWSEHARWFPECGYVQLVMGREYTERCRGRDPHARQPSSDVELSVPRRVRTTGSRVQFPVTESQVESEMESTAALAALGTGLDAARVRTAIRRRFANTGVPFASSEALIDAALNEQLNEEAWSASPGSQRLARDILQETLRTFSAAAEPWEDRASPEPDRSVSPADSLNHAHPPASPPAPPPPPPLRPPAPRPAASPPRAAGPEGNVTGSPEDNVTGRPEGADKASPSVQSSSSLEEENRQLKEARLCKVCMDCEVSVVFLPCGHLVSCGACGASLAACPLCRAAVRALVRAYLA